MKTYLARGECQKCGAKEVVAHSGYKHLCQRCDAKLYRTISEEQKENYMQTGHINRERIQNSFEKRAKILKNEV